MYDIEVFSGEGVEIVSDLLARSFSSTAAKTMSEEGANTFLKGVTPEEILKRIQKGNIFHVCKFNDQIVGVSELRDGSHLNLLFVEIAFQNRGIGRQLFNALREYVEGRDITVNSSLNAIPAYKALGFTVSAPENEVRGITFQPMLYSAPT